MKSSSKKYNLPGIVIGIFIIVSVIFVSLFRGRFDNVKEDILASRNSQDSEVIALDLDNTPTVLGSNTEEIEMEMDVAIDILNRSRKVNGKAEASVGDYESTLDILNSIGHELEQIELGERELEETGTVKDKNTSVEPNLQLSNKDYVQVAQRGDGVTHLSRRALSSYLSDNNMQLESYQRLYVEVNLTNSKNPGVIYPGEQRSFNFSEIERLIFKSKDLSSHEIDAWSKNAKLVIY